MKPFPATNALRAWDLSSPPTWCQRHRQNLVQGTAWSRRALSNPRARRLTELLADCAPALSTQRRSVYASRCSYISQIIKDDNIFFSFLIIFDTFPCLLSSFPSLILCIIYICFQLMKLINFAAQTIGCPSYHPFTPSYADFKNDDTLSHQSP